MEINVGPASYRDGAWSDFRPKTVVYFEDRPVPDAVETKKNERPCFKNRTFIVKITPGDRLLRVERYASDQDKLEFAAEWKSYKEKHDKPVEGTPLEEWAAITKTMCLEMRAVNIHTVEQLASLSDSVVQKFMGGQMYRQKAQAFLKGQHSEDELKKELDETKKKMAEMQKQIEALTKGAETPAKKPGRPKKVKHGTDSPPVGNSSV